MSQKYVVKKLGNKMVLTNVGARPFDEFSTEEGLDKQYEKFQTRLLIYLTANGLSQTEFSRLMKKAALREGKTLKDNWVSFGRSAVSNWCRGTYCAERQRRAIICKYTGIPDEWLVGRVPRNAISYTDTDKKAMIFHLDDPGFMPATARQGMRVRAA